MSNITYRDGLAIGELVFYLPALAIAIFLGVRHGFKRSSGWRFMIVFCLARTIGACMQLATIAQPKNISLFIGSATLLNIAISPLELVALGLLSRVISSINKTHQTLITSRHIKYAELFNLVGLICGIVGGTQSGEDYGHTGVFTPQATSKAGLALFIATFVVIAIGCVVLFPSISHAEKGEKRILIAIAASLPFLLVRLVYSIMSTFVNNRNFSIIVGDSTILLCMGLIMEAIMVVIYEGFGLTLKKLPKEEKAREGHKDTEMYTQRV